jgi:hypothetical protein
MAILPDLDCHTIHGACFVKVIIPDKGYQAHPDVVKRLKRAEGHLRRIISMVEEGPPCLDDRTVTT